MTEPTATEAVTNEQPWPGRFFAITLFVDDIEASKAFYQSVFGLAPTYEDESSTGFQFPNLFVNLLATTHAPELVEPAVVAGPETGSRFVLTIEVADVDAICADLATRGVTLLNGPMDRRWGPRTASFQDPNGHIFEIAS